MHRYLAPIGVNICVMVKLCPVRIFSTSGGDIFSLVVSKDGVRMFFWTVCLRRNFGGLRHKQLLSTDAWPCHSSVDIVYCAYGRRLTCDKLRRSSKR